jgi:hypothetical protein
MNNEQPIINLINKKKKTVRETELHHQQKTQHNFQTAYILIFCLSTAAYFDDLFIILSKPRTSPFGFIEKLILIDVAFEIIQIRGFFNFRRVSGKKMLLKDLRRMRFTSKQSPDKPNRSIVSSRYLVAIFHSGKREILKGSRTNIHPSERNKLKVS